MTLAWPRPQCEHDLDSKAVEALVLIFKQKIKTAEALAQAPVPSKAQAAAAPVKKESAPAPKAPVVKKKKKKKDFSKYDKKTDDFDAMESGTSAGVEAPARGAEQTQDFDDFM